MRDQLDPPPDHTNAEGIRLLAEALEAHGFAAGRVEEISSSGGSGLAPLPLIARRLEPGDPVSVLIALFLHGSSVSATAAESVLDPLGLSGAERLGIVIVDGDTVTATIRVGPFGHLLLASDRRDAPLRDFVMAGAGSTRTLAHLTIRRPVRTALDLGTGSGVHALLAAPYAGTVTATDVSPRALAFARFNARLNGIDNVEFVEGSWYDAVPGRQFDLVLSNPPFVIAPEGEFLFRDGLQGGVGDRVSRDLVEATPGHLCDGGVAQFLVNWVHDPATSWSNPIRSWVDGSGCDAWILRGVTDGPGGYTLTWNAHLANDPVAHAASVDRWLAFFEDRGIHAIGFGLLTMRRSRSAPWFHADEMPESPGQVAGAQLASTLDAHDVLGRLGDVRDLLAARPVTNPKHQLEQVLALRGGRYEVEAARVRLRAPLAFTADVDVFAATLLTMLDGSRTLAEAAEAAAPVLEQRPDDLDGLSAGLVASMMVMGLVSLPDTVPEGANH